MAKPDPYTLAGLAISALGLAYLVFGGGPTVAYPRVQGTNARDLILDEFRRAGLSKNMGIAAAVNAYAESGWDSWAIGDNGHSVGLFQLFDGLRDDGTVRDRNALGYSIAMPRQSNGQPNPADPRFIAERNIAVVIAAVRRDHQLMSAQGIAPPAALVRMFTLNIERPAGGAASAEKRVALLARLFPTEA